MNKGKRNNQTDPLIQRTNWLPDRRRVRGGVKKTKRKHSIKKEKKKRERKLSNFFLKEFLQVYIPSSDKLGSKFSTSPPTFAGVNLFNCSHPSGLNLHLSKDV